MALINKFVYAQTEAGLKASTGSYDNNSIVFIADKGVILTHGKEFGVPASKLAEIENDLSSLKGIRCFNAISDGDKSFQAAEGAQTITFSGDNKTITVEVSEDGVTIKGVEVTAQGDSFVSATASGGKVTVKANVVSLSEIDGDDTTGEGALAEASDVKEYVDAQVASATDDRVDTIIEAVGLGEDGSYQAQGSSNYLESATSIAEETAALDGELKTLADKLTAEIAKLTGSKTIKGGTTYETNLKIALVAAADSTPAKISLQDGSGTELSSVSLSEILGKHIVKSSSYSETTGKLTVVFETAGGTDQSVEIDLGKLLDINDVVIASGSSDYLEADIKTVSADNSQLELSVKLGDVSEGTSGLADASDVKDYVDEAIEALDKTEATVTGTNVSFKYKEEDGIVTVSDLTETYATVTKTASAVTVTGETGLVTGADIKKLAEYVDAKFGDSSAIDALDAEVTSEDGDYVEVKVTQEDGVVTEVSVSETIGNYTGTDGLATTTATKAYVDGLFSWIEIN